MFDVNDVNVKNALLKYMNLDELSFDEFLIITNLNIKNIGYDDDPDYIHGLWDKVVDLKLGGEFDKFTLTRGDKKWKTTSYIDGKEIGYSIFNDWDNKTFNTIESFGGEGKGDYAYKILKHLSSSRYLRVTGNYQSHDGYNWSGSYFVEVNQIKVEKIEYINAK